MGAPLEVRDLLAVLIRHDDVVDALATLLPSGGAGGGERNAMLDELVRKASARRSRLEQLQ